MQMGRLIGLYGQQNIRSTIGRGNPLCFLL
ncbi:hypothetical protein SAMN06265218_108137 [Fodinibius sediminis]|uniref:Uncharacterized protein n=1 Tax=Fodinibius sediminis TaxID=1214077 RepID=A0A521D4L5_9BACT|nr:hypothetical protein SAMN06265218_108137 [Fodinibius sediminis]